MIRTICLSPCIDVSIEVDELAPTRKLRVDASVREPGGGGVNVAIVARRLHAAVECVLATGGATGKEVVEFLGRDHIPTLEIESTGPTRESIHIFEKCTQAQYRLVAEAPPVATDPREAIAQFRAGQSPVVTVLSGSLPARSTPDTYASLAKLHHGSFVIVDTSGPALIGSLKERIDLIKPSLSEFERLTGTETRNAEALSSGAEYLLNEHPKLGSIVVSLGKQGAVLFGRSGQPIHARHHGIDAVSAVGAGDSMVAGLAVGLARGWELSDALRLGVACGTSAVLTPGSGLCSGSAARELYETVEVGLLEPGADIV